MNYQRFYKKIEVELNSISELHHGHKHIIMIMIYQSLMHERDMRDLEDQQTLLTIREEILKKENQVQ